jgi:hypothetical protein
MSNKMDGVRSRERFGGELIRAVQDIVCKVARPFRQSSWSYLFALALTIIFPHCLYSQEPNSKPIVLVEYCGALTHQHQDFFGEPFSFTGAECFVIINHHFLGGGYGSSFLSPLRVEGAGDPLFLYLRQAGLAMGVSTNDSTMLHAGALLNVGAMKLYYSSTVFSLLKRPNVQTQRTGLVITPQAFVELNLTRWFRTRVGLAYTLCVIDTLPQVRGADLQNFSLNFGFVFGTFKNSKACFK